MLSGKWIVGGSRGIAWSAFQWQPTRTAHDPKPPLTIEHETGQVVDVMPLLIMAPMLPPRTMSR